MAGILDGKISLITGASSGIGRATAKIFAREGARLVLADVAEAGGQETLQAVKQLGAEAIFVKTDVSKVSRMWTRWWPLLYRPLDGWTARSTMLELVVVAY